MGKNPATKKIQYEREFENVSSLLQQPPSSGDCSGTELMVVYQQWVFVQWQSNHWPIDEDGWGRPMAFFRLLPSLNFLFEVTEGICQFKQ